MNINKLIIDKKKIINTDCSFLLNFYDNTGHIASAQKHLYPTIEHYRLLTYLSYQIDNICIIDAGTYHGLSAICLAQNNSNTILSYDLYAVNRNLSFGSDPCQFQHNPIGNSYKNITFLNQNILLIDKNVLLSASIIFLDIIHDGVSEKVFLDKLIEIGYRGILICDDIKMNQPMIDWFNSITYNKYDITDIGHITGTGLVVLGDIEVIIKDNI
jgi:hypothetical protein